MTRLSCILILCISSLFALEDDLTELNLSHKGQVPSKARIVNIDYVLRFPHLQRLNLEDCRRLGDNCRVVAQVTTLTELNLACVGITSIAFLAPLVNLTCLDLSGNSRLPSIEGLNLPKLRDLKLKGNYHIRDFRPLQNLTSLVKLNLNCIFNVVDNLIANRLDFLTCLHSLRKLDIGGNDYFYNIEFLLKMFSLRSLSIHSSKSIQHLELIGQMTWLTSLDVSCTYQDNITYVQTLTNIEKLTIDPGHDIPPLSVFPKLKKLTRY